MFLFSLLYTLCEQERRTRGVAEDAGKQRWTQERKTVLRKGAPRVAAAIRCGAMPRKRCYTVYLVAGMTEPTAKNQWKSTWRESARGVVSVIPFKPIHVVTSARLSGKKKTEPRALRAPGRLRGISASPRATSTSASRTTWRGARAREKKARQQERKELGFCASRLFVRRFLLEGVLPPEVCLHGGVAVACAVPGHDRGALRD